MQLMPIGRTKGQRLPCNNKALFVLLSVRERSGAEEACWAHNPEVHGSKPCSAKYFVFVSFCSGSSFFFFFTSSAVGGGTRGRDSLFFLYISFSTHFQPYLASHQHHPEKTNFHFQEKLANASTSLPSQNKNLQTATTEQQPRKAAKGTMSHRSAKTTSSTRAHARRMYTRKRQSYSMHTPTGSLQ